MHLTSPVNRRAKNTRNPPHAGLRREALRSRPKGDTAAMHLRSGLEAHNSTYSTPHAEGASEEIAVVGNEAGAKVGDTPEEERQARMIDVLESASGLDLDGDKRVSGEYQVRWEGFRCSDSIGSW